MKNFMLVLIICISASIASAQLAPAYHEAESADMAFTGSWVQLIAGDYVVMESSTIGDSVEFEINGDSLAVYRELLTAGGATVQICIDAVCDTFTSNSTTDMYHVPIAYTAPVGATPHTVTLTNTDGGVFRFDAVLVMPAATLDEISVADASKYFYSANGYTFAVDASISGGDIAQIILTLVLFVFTFGILFMLGYQTWKL